MPSPDRWTHLSTDAKRRVEMKEILYATDFTLESLSALPYALSLAQENRARLMVLHVIGGPEAEEVISAKELHRIHAAPAP